ncbi:MAG: hydroxyacylglutathione hydrolase C-terminal domain-containing protein, partial [Simkaniaceae bacterium]|nr:hydroxyacylglutathione hydrolase C-terminal domain-containing protein [Simkaniaceae bacterium]
CRLIAPSDERIANVDELAIEGKALSFLGMEIEVIATPGHTRCDITYYFPTLKAAFTGDTLFSAGCGRLFEGSANEMFTSLHKIAALPDETKLYFGHEYTEKNLLFAHDIEPDNAAVTKELSNHKEPTTPTTVEKEKAINLFLRAKTPDELSELRDKKNAQS